MPGPAGERPRVAVVHHGFVPPFRVAFFERLARAGEVEYVFFHGEAPRATGHRAAAGPFSFPNVRVRNRQVGVGHRSVILQPIVRRVAGGGFAGLVVGAELKFPASFATAVAMRLRGKPFVLWGHGYDTAEDAGVALRSFGTAAKARYARHADAYLVYTEGGARQLAARGIDPERITVVRNTLDVAAQGELRRRFADADEATLRRDLGLRADSVVLLHLGRAYREKHLDELVEAVRRLGARAGLPPVEVAVLGDGPDLPRISELASEVPGVHLPGAVYDEEHVARWLRVAAVLATPGKVGLAVNHALAHGVPVVTRASDVHAPEVEYLEHGVNALIVPGDLDAYVSALAEIVTSAARREALASGALRSSERLGLDHMVRAFDAGVRGALARRSGGRRR